MSIASDLENAFYLAKEIQEATKELRLIRHLLERALEPGAPNDAD